MSETNLALSPLELRLAADAEILLTKNAIIDKTKGLFNLLQDKQEKYLTAQFNLGKTIVDTSPKISRGENYKGLPYVVLDYPRIFEKDNIAAIRTMFWWGNFFSITLHLSGRYKNQFERQILRAYTRLKEEDYYCAVNKNEWEHHFENTNYNPIKKLSYEKFEKAIQEKPFLKIAYSIPIEQWNKAGKILYVKFTEMVDLMTDQAPRR